jgi:hypothetical protein
MATVNSNLRPRAESAADVAGQRIFTHGAMNVRELFATINFGHKMHHKKTALKRALESGWLVQQEDGTISIGTFARVHYESLAADKVAPVGQIAALREHVDVFTRPVLSKKYMPNPRGTRQDIPAWSVRSGQSFHTKA